MVTVGIVTEVVDSHADREISITGRSRNDDALDALLLEVLFRSSSRSEKASGVDDDVHPLAVPGDLGGVAHLEASDVAPVNQDVVIVRDDVVVEQRTADRIVLEQLCEMLVATLNVVNRYQLNVGDILLEQNAMEVPANAAVTVDTNPRNQVFALS